MSSRQFDLICSGEKVINSKTKGIFSTRFRVDLNAKSFCVDDCVRTFPISRVTDTALEYHCDSRGKSKYCDYPYNSLDVQTVRENWSISLDKLDLRDERDSVEGDIVAIFNHESRTGACAVEPFTGFNGEFLYPEGAETTEDSEPGAPDRPGGSREFAAAYGPNVLLRMIAAPKFGHHYALWLWQDAKSYHVSSTHDEGCDRQVDGGLAERLIRVWRSVLQLTDAVGTPRKGNRTIFHFSMRGDFSVPAGWTKDPEQPRLSRSFELMSVGTQMIRYCETGDAEALNTQVGILESWPQ